MLHASARPDAVYRFGKSLMQKEGGPVEAVRPGDVVWIPPLVKHWHGASASEAMMHFAVAEALDGSVVTWMEKLSVGRA